MKTKKNLLQIIVLLGIFTLNGCNSINSVNQGDRLSKINLPNNAEIQNKAITKGAYSGVDYNIKEILKLACDAQTELITGARWLFKNEDPGPKGTVKYFTQDRAELTLYCSGIADDTTQIAILIEEK